MSILIGRAIAPIEKLKKATTKIAKGDFEVELTGNDYDEIGVLTNNFNIMVNELKNIELLRSDFISNVSHEFKTPIASIQGFAEMLQNKNLPDKKKLEYIKIISEEAARLNVMISNILKLSQFENQIISINYTEFALDEQLRRIILILENKWTAKNIKFNLNLDNITVNCDEKLLEQVWINLIDNAIKFSNADGEIIINLTETDNDAIVTIKDNGVGIPETALPRIYEKFYQADNSRFENGNGLGLSIVKKIIQLCSGTIEVKSVINEGTEFKISISKNLNN